LRQLSPSDIEALEYAVKQYAHYDFKSLTDISLEAYQEGDTPSYGENIVVKQNEKTGIKWITGTERGHLGKIKYSTNLSGNFDLFIKAEHLGMTIFLIANDEYKIELDFWVNGADLKAGGSNAGNDQSQAWTGSINDIRLAVVNNVAKLYANDVFSKKMSLRPGLSYTQLLVHLDTRDDLYELKIGGSSTSGSTTTEGTKIGSTIRINLREATEFSTF